jgi:hypothetical protein
MGGFGGLHQQFTSVIASKDWDQLVVAKRECRKLLGDERPMFIHPFNQNSIIARRVPAKMKPRLLADNVSGDYLCKLHPRSGIMNGQGRYTEDDKVRVLRPEL